VYQVTYIMDIHLCYEVALTGVLKKGAYGSENIGEPTFTLSFNSEKSYKIK